MWGTHLAFILDCVSLDPGSSGIKLTLLESHFLGGFPEIFGTKWSEILVLHKGTRPLLQDKDFNVFCPKDFWGSSYTSGK